MTVAIKDDFPLGIAGFSFADLYEPRRLRALHDEFWKYAGNVSPDLATRFNNLDDPSVAKPEVSEVLIDVAGLLGDFLGRLFDIRSDVQNLANDTFNYEIIFQFKQQFLRPRVFKLFGTSCINDDAFQSLDDDVWHLVSAVPPQLDPEIRFSDTVLTLLHCQNYFAGKADDSQNAAAELICAHGNEATLEGNVNEALDQLAEWCVQVNRAQP